MFEFLYSTGVRLGELLDLKVEDINLEDSLATVRDTKDKKDRVVILNEISRKYMKL